MQATAILEAAAEVQARGIKVLPEIMVPLVSYEKELELQKAVIDEAAADVRKKLGLRASQLKYQVGTMIEIPRAALKADEVSKHADFFSFGTNDLTQLTYGFSRDDMGKFLPAYLADGILAQNPLVSFDIDGVGQLVEIGTQKGRHSNARLKVGVCGEHGGDPKGIAFFHKIGLDYVSCSPFRVPVARLAAAQVALRQ